MYLHDDTISCIVLCKSTKWSQITHTARRFSRFQTSFSIKESSFSIEESSFLRQKSSAMDVYVPAVPNSAGLRIHHD